MCTRQNKQRGMLQWKCSIYSDRFSWKWLSVRRWLPRKAFTGCTLSTSRRCALIKRHRLSISPSPVLAALNDTSSRSDGSDGRGAIESINFLGCKFRSDWHRKWAVYQGRAAVQMYALGRPPIYWHTRIKPQQFFILTKMLCRATGSLGTRFHRQTHSKPVICVLFFLFSALRR